MKSFNLFYSIRIYLSSVKNVSGANYANDAMNVNNEYSSSFACQPTAPKSNLGSSVLL